MGHKDTVIYFEFKTATKCFMYSTYSIYFQLAKLDM